MRGFSRRSAIAVVALLVTVYLPSAFAAPPVAELAYSQAESAAPAAPPTAEELDQIGRAAEKVTIAGLAAEVLLKEHECVIHTIACGQTVNGELTDHDCALNDGTFVDFWAFDGVDGSTATIDLSSPDFNTFLLLLDPTPRVVTSDNDSGPGTNSRIVHTLDSTGEWTIAANNLTVGPLGDYTLSLACSGTGGGQKPAKPSDLTAQALSSSQIRLDWMDNSNNEDGFRVDLRPPGGDFSEIGTVGPGVVAATVSGVPPSSTIDFRIRAFNSAGSSGYSNVATATTDGEIEPCVPNAQTLCLLDDRFQVKADWRTPQGAAGFGTGVELTPDTGYFYFFNPDNVEMVVKVLDACNDPFNHFWVFAGGLTNVEVDIVVTDSQTGDVSAYRNPLRTPFQPIQDTSAFATCP